jgi:hypothetical protein
MQREGRAPPANAATQECKISPQMVAMLKRSSLSRESFELNLIAEMLRNQR